MGVHYFLVVPNEGGQSPSHVMIEANKSHLTRVSLFAYPRRYYLIKINMKKTLRKKQKEMSQKGNL
jgi:hypothetical protein